jgi:hypothetical protein
MNRAVAAMEMGLGLGLEPQRERFEQAVIVDSLIESARARGEEMPRSAALRLAEMLRR